MRDILAQFVDITREAGFIALRDFKLAEQTAATVHYKHGGSPVTAADIATDTYLRETCARVFTDCAWLSEETIDNNARLSATKLIIADPIDGTRAYIAGNPHWCVSLAMLEHGRPVMGCLYAPALDELYVASLGQGATLNNVPLFISGNEKNNILGPKPMVAWFNQRFKTDYTILPKIPSLALRLAHVSTGRVALALASDNAHDWDIAAADLIICEAGGILVDFNGQRPVYNQPKPVHAALFACSEIILENLMSHTKI